MRGCMGQCGGSMKPATASKLPKSKEVEDALAVVRYGSQSEPGTTYKGESPQPPSTPRSPGPGGPPRLWGKKRLGVTAESATAASVPIIPKSDASKALIAESIRDNLLFQDMPAAALEVIIDSMHPVSVPPGTDVIRQGDSQASEFYVLEDGMCEVWVKPPGAGTKAQKVLHYAKGSSFGELALLYSAPRAATVRSVTHCKLWIMQRSVFGNVKRNFTHEQFVARHALLGTVEALRTLTPHQRARLVDALQPAEFKAGKHVFYKGDPGGDFYIVSTGTALVKDGANVLARLQPGQYFGERALMNAEVHAADVVAESNLLCYKLSRKNFDELLGSNEDIWRFEALKKVPILYNLSERQLWQLARAMEGQAFAKGDIVFRKGDAGDTFYIIQQGAFTVFDEAGKELARVGEGSCFGELALLRQDVRAANVGAISDSKVLVLHRDMFVRLMGSLTQLRHVWRFEALGKVPLMGGLDHGQRAGLAQALEHRTVAKGEDVVKQGDIGDKFFIVEHGELGVFKDGCPEPIMKYGPGSYFGELSLLRNEPRAATVRATGDGVSLLSLDRPHFAALMGPLLVVLQREAENYKQMAGVGKRKVIDINNARATAVLGAGGFGQVLLVQYKDDYFALKCISKAFVLEQGLVNHVKREKMTMVECSSPFLVELVGTAQDDATLYMMMEAVMGGELFAYLQTRSKPLDESHAQFYAASVILALEYLHDRDLVYRDLKPENLLIDLQGYVKVTDFGFVKRLKKGTKTYTLCGTPEYLAPEIVMNKGHGYGADWWALGVLIFELCCGMPPFMHDDRLVMFKKICSQEYTMPSTFSPALADLVRRLLEPNPAFRLGTGKAGAADLKQHPFFADFDWVSFAAKKLPAPYIPRQPKNGADTCNFAKMNANEAMFRKKAYVSKGNFTDF